LTTNGPIWSFTTICGAYGVPFTENFDSYTTPAVGCGVVQDVNGDAVKWASSTLTTYNGANKLSIGYSAAGFAMDDWYFLPGLILTGGVSYDVKFYYRVVSATYPERLEVKWGNAPAASAMTSSAIFSLTDFTTAVYTLGTSSFTPSSSGTYYVGWHCFSQGDEDGIYLDQIVVEPTPSCPAPINLTAGSVGATTAQLGWTETGSATAWQYQIGLTGFTPAATGTPTTANPTPVSGLLASTSYDFYVRANCSGTYSAWTGPMTFTTACASVAIPWCETFDAMTTIGNNILPPCWKAESASGTPWTTADATTITYNDPCSAPNYIYVNWNPSTSNKFLITPGINLTVGISYDFKFNWIGDSYSGWTGDALVNSSQTGTGATVLGTSFVVAATTTTAVCTPAKRTFVPPATGTYYFMVRVSNNYTPYDLGFDDFCVDVTPPCSEPINLTANSIGLTTANLAWTPVGTVNNWEYAYGIAPFGPPAGAGTPTTSSTTNPISGLSSGTTYQFYVRTNCGPSYTVWAGPYAFNTLCGSFSIPYTQNFDAVTAPTIPPCMTVTNDNGDAYLWQTTTSYSRSAPNCIDIHYNAALAMDDWFFTAPLNLAAGTYKVSFWYKAALSSYPEKMEVKWGSNPDAASMTSAAIFDNNNITSTTFSEGVGNMVIVTPGIYYVGWHGYSALNMDLLMVDDISITLALAHDVGTLSIDNIPTVSDLTPMNPKATVKNFGSNTETFNVTMTIGSYSSVKTVTALAPNASQVVIFDTWTPTIGSYTATACTNLGTDLEPANNCQTVSGTAYNYTRFYGYVAYAGTSGLPVGPGFFYKEAPGTIVSLGPQTSEDFICAGTWAAGRWYGSEYYDPDYYTGGGWYNIDPATGAMTLLASLSRSFTGITYDHTAGIMYGVDYDDVALTNNLYSIIPATGAATLIGTIAAGELLINLATDGSGYLYAIGITTDHLFKINPVGPTSTDVGAAGLDLSYAQDMEYDYASSTMYAAAETPTVGQLMTVDLATGTLTLVGGFMGDAEITGLAIPYSSVPATLTVTNTTVTSGQTPCYNATGTITVSGFTVESGGSANFISGTNILYEPNTWIKSGGYMHGIIATSYCGGSSPSMPAVIAGKEDTQVSFEQANFAIYPNPTTGNFTLVQKGDKLYGNVSVEVYNMRGEKVITERMIGDKSHEFRFSTVPDGLYFVKVVADDYVETIKLIKTR